MRSRGFDWLGSIEEVLAEYFFLKEQLKSCNGEGRRRNYIHADGGKTVRV
jgi:hypothetical protein